MITRKFILLIFISISLLIADKFKMLTLVKSPLEVLIIPIQKNLYLNFTRIRSIPDNIRQYVIFGEKIDEVRILKEKKNALELKVTLLTEENSMLRRQLGAKLPPSYQFIPATVIALSDSMEINLGKINGVSEGMSVVFEDFLIGQVKSVDNNRSRVRTLTDREIRIPAKTNRQTRGVVMGGGSGNILIDKVLQKDPLFIDDLVLSSGQDGFLPNMIVGKISHITSNDVEVYKSALIEAGIDISRLNTVFVVKSV